MSTSPVPDLSALPNVCAHEHWGSLTAFELMLDGFRADCVRGARPTRDVDLLDILLDPYFGGWLSAAGAAPWAAALEAGHQTPQAWMRADRGAALAWFRAGLENSRLTGAYQCIRRGILHLYGLDIEGMTPEAIELLDTAITAAYRDCFAWYPAAMAKAGFSGLIRPVHPEFYYLEDSPESAVRESAFMRTVMRIDPLLALWPVECSRRDDLAAKVGVNPVDAESWRAFLSALFAKAADGGAVGIKQLQAYSRPLSFEPRKDSEVTWRGALDPGQARVFQDWMVHECCKLANERGWPHQVHVGTHNLNESGPLPLGALASQYPHMRIVMLHCWPFLDECGWLAKHVGSMYIDTCWMPILNPAFYRKALGEWLNYIPASKIMCSHDATSIEMATGSSLFTREILAESLAGASDHLGIGLPALESLALKMLDGNARNVYGLKP